MEDINIPKHSEEMKGKDKEHEEQEYNIISKKNTVSEKLFLELGNKISKFDKKLDKLSSNFESIFHTKGIEKRLDDIISKFDTLLEKIFRMHPYLNDGIKELLQEQTRDLTESFKLELKRESKEENVALKRQILDLNESLLSLQSSKENLEREKETLKKTYSKKITELEERLSTLHSMKEELKKEKESSEKVYLKEILDLKERLSNIELDKQELIVSLKITEEKKENLKKDYNKIKKISDYVEEKILKPYEEFLNFLDNKKLSDLKEYLKLTSSNNFKNSLVVFSIISEYQLAKKVQAFYYDRKEALTNTDIELIEKINRIYVSEKPWGILYAEKKGKYNPSLVRDRQSSRQYKSFSTMYSPAYRVEENANSPLKGIVDGEI